MLEVLKKTANKTYTENGALTHRSTGKDCLDLFAAIGALRRESDLEIERRFLKAYTEDRDLAMKILFYARDVRGGLGERRVFRVILRWLAFNETGSVLRNLPYIAEYGRWDDVLVLLNTPCRKAALALLKQQFEADLAAMEQSGDISLLGKWLPSVNASNPETVALAKLIAKSFGLTDRDYRKALVKLRAQVRILENNLREKDYTFDYAKQPSKAMFKYRKAFLRNDGERYGAFMEKVQRGEAKLHTGTLLPYEIVEPCLEFTWYRQESFMRPLSEEEKLSLNATWGALEDFTTDENALAVVDTSGSMYGQSNPMPAAVALSLGLYFAERAKGPYRNHFIQFSAHPELIEIKGHTFADRLRYIASFNEVANTNLEAVFDLILEAAVENRVTQSELPAKLYIISDMEFDACVRDAKLTNFENAKQNYARRGYKLPQIVFWNVASRHQQQPVTVNDRGVALASGCSPRIFSMAMEGELNPYDYMLRVVNTERYAPIAA
ncbi:MAG: DUF2828 family protein [Oscillospiraceae bacterium]|nr:DUF2828 family protein [Oscillospiraceae bacterium]